MIQLYLLTLCCITVIGVMDGHYSLDLGNQMDKFCLNKLLEVGMTIAFRRAKKRYRNTLFYSHLYSNILILIVSPRDGNFLFNSPPHSLN